MLLLLELTTPRYVSSLSWEQFHYLPLLRVGAQLVLFHRRLTPSPRLGLSRHACSRLGWEYHPLSWSSWPRQVNLTTLGQGCCYRLQAKVH